jgi:ribosomal-protein-alanine N-acetyltransferase
MAPEKYQLFHYRNNLRNLAEIVNLEQVSFQSFWSRESLRVEIANPLTLLSIIKVSSAPELTGYSLTRIISPEAELLKLAIRPGARRRGAATILLDGIFKKIRSLKVNKIYLEVSEKNQQAIALYQKSGFNTTTRRPHYYDNGTTGALLMTLSL